MSISTTRPSKRPSGMLSSLGCEILAYLTRRPQARDTLEGIAEWWLLEQRLHSARWQVKCALSELVENGLVMEQSGADGRTHYGVNRRKLGRIRQLIADPASGQAAES